MRIELSLRSVFAIIAIVAGLWLLARLWQIVLVIVIGVVLAGSFSPVVDWLERRRVPRGVALGLILLLLLGGVAGLGFLVIPALLAQVIDAVRDAPEHQARIADFLATAPEPLHNYAATVRDFKPEQYLAPVGSYAVAYAPKVVEIVAYGVTTVVLAFYLIADRERVLGSTYALLPRRYHVRTARVLLDMERVVGGYVRGQAITSISIGVFVFVLLSVLGVPNALALAIFAALTDLVPFIGGILAAIPAILTALTVSPTTAVIVWVGIFLYQQFEDRILIPRIYGRTLRLSPVAVLIALLVGGTLLGIVGALLALPIAAGIRVLIEDLRVELPGDQPGEDAQRERDDLLESAFAERAAGSSAIEAALIATELANQAQVEEVPAEEASDNGPARPEGLPNPAAPGR
ncbi:MAG: AI-2E family transporter [Thermomicrobiales bacterium]